MTTRSPSRTRLAALSLVAAVVALGALASRAAAAPISCHGHANIASATDAGDMGNAVQYLFGCSDTVTSYTVISSNEIEEYSPNGFVTNQAGDLGQPGQKDFSCGGDLPGFGTNCADGTAAGGFQIKGVFGLTKDRCGNGRSAKPAQLSLVVADAKGATWGPFALGQPRECKALLRKRAAQRRKRHRRHR